SLAAMVVELGEDVVEDQHRLTAVIGLAPQQVVRRQPQRQGERPGLAMAGVTLGRQRPQRQDQLVAVRADEGDAPVELLTTYVRQCTQQPLRDGGPVTSG